MYREDRRTFLKKGIAIGGALLGWPLAGSGRSLFENTGRARVVISKDEALRDVRGDLDVERVEGMLDRGMKALFDLPSVEEAWRALIRPDDTVGIKVNGLAGRGMSTKPEIVQGIIRKLERIGVQRRRIIVWDRLTQDLTRAGYEPNVGGGDIQCYGNDVGGFDRRLVVYGTIGSLLSRILVDRCSVVINVPILKDHSICGVTVGMKNFFGAIHNPNKYHMDVGDPYIADLNALDVIRKKNVLTVVDAISAQYEGGPPYMPQWSWKFNGILIGTDPVAMDYTSWQIVERKRAEKGLKSLKEADREPTYIATAADKRLGTDDPSKIEVVTT